MRTFAVAIAVLGLASCDDVTSGVATPPDSFPIASAAQTRAPSSQAELTLSFAPVVKRAAPAVVNIYTRKVVERRVSPFAGDPFFERFFGDVFRNQPRRRIENSLGSGVIVDPAGIVVSNHHVVAGADQITVVLQDRREFEGRVIFADEESDLAVVELEDAPKLPTLELRDSDTLQVGDLVLAIGNPFGVGQTVTSGIVSGLARSGGARGGGDGFLIQTDAAINPGNSGGALVDMQGRLVGVNTSIVSRSGGSNGIGFAVPANLVARVINSAKAGETRLIRPWLGADTQEVTGEIASSLGLSAPSGILIRDLHPDSPLTSAGLRRGDLIIELDGDLVNSRQELDFRLATLGAGSTARLTYLRDEQERRASVRLIAAPELPDRDARDLGPRDGLPGLSVVTVNPAVIEELGLPVSTSGVLVTRVRGAASQVGLRRGDVVLGVNGTEVNRSRDLVTALRRARGGTELEVLRKGKRGTIRFRL